MRETRLLAREESSVLPVRLAHGLQIIRLLPRPEVAERAATSKLVRGENLRGAGLEEVERVRLGEDAVEILGGDLDASLRAQRAQDSGVLLERVGGHDDAAVGVIELLVTFGFGEHGVADGQIANEATVVLLPVRGEDLLPPACLVLQ